MRRIVLGMAVVLLVAGTAQAVTIRDIIELSRAGVGEEVLLALVQVDGGLFNVDRETLTKLKAAGVSEKVIVALIRSGRTDAPEQVASVPPPAPPPETVYVQPAPTIEVVREIAVPVAVPVYVPVPVSVRTHGRFNDRRTVNVVEPSITAPALIQGGTRFQTDTPPRHDDAEPVYWGWGGRLRPDAWNPKR